MLEHDKHQFAEIYRGVCATYGREASKEAMRIAWNALAAYDIQQVTGAYTAHLMRSRFMPTPADIIGAIQDNTPAMRRPGADEAWALMPRDETDNVVWTEEMAYAWSVASGLVNPLTVERPDWIAARMAFKDAYNRAVETSRAQGKPATWTVCRGTRKDNLEDVLNEAMRLGYISRDEAKPHLAELEHVRPVNQQLLLEGAKESPEAVRETALEAVAKLRAMLTPDPAALEAAREEAKRYCEAKDRQREHHGRADAA